MPALGSVTVDLSLVLATVPMPLRDVLRLRRGATVPLGVGCDSPSELHAGGQPVAIGFVEVGGERITMRIAQMVGGGC